MSKVILEEIEVITSIITKILTNLLSRVRIVTDGKVGDVLLDGLGELLWCEAHGVDVVGPEFELLFGHDEVLFHRP